MFVVNVKYDDFYLLNHPKKITFPLKEEFFVFNVFKLNYFNLKIIKEQDGIGQQHLYIVTICIYEMTKRRKKGKMHQIPISSFSFSQIR